MRVIGITCARNEADIIEAFVRHTVTFCDQVIVLDHGSSDETPVILRALQAEGVNLRVISDATLGLFQTAHMKQLLKMAAVEYGADWIACLDVDEFLQGDLPGALSQAAANDPVPRCLHLPLRNYVAHPDDAKDKLNPVERMTYRDQNEFANISSAVCKVIVPGGLAREDSGFLEQGNHRFWLNGFEAPFRLLEDVWLAHFSIRLPGQYAGKLAAKCMQKYRGKAKRTGNSDHYDGPYRQLREGYSSFVADFFNARLSWKPSNRTENLVHDPIKYYGEPLRYTHSACDTDQFIKQTLDLMEKLASTGASHEGPEAMGEVTPRHDTPHAPAASLCLCGNSISPIGAVQFITSSGADFQLATFSLRELPEQDFVDIGVSTEPCLFEISDVELTYDDSSVSKVKFDFHALKSLICIMDRGCIIHSAGLVRIMVSPSPMRMRLRFSNDREVRSSMPAEVTLRVRFIHDHALVVSTLLAQNVVGKLISKATVSSELKRVHEELHETKTKSREKLEKIKRKAQEELTQIQKRPLKFLLRTWRDKLQRFLRFKASCQESSQPAQPGIPTTPIHATPSKEQESDAVSSTGTAGI